MSQIRAIHQAVANRNAQRGIDPSLVYNTPNSFSTPESTYNGIPPSNQLQGTSYPQNPNGFGYGTHSLPQHGEGSAGFVYQEGSDDGFRFSRHEGTSAQHSRTNSPNNQMNDPEEPPSSDGALPASSTSMNGTGDGRDEESDEESDMSGDSDDEGLEDRVEFASNLTRKRIRNTVRATLLSPHSLSYKAGMIKTIEVLLSIIPVDAFGSRNTHTLPGYYPEEWQHIDAGKMGQ
ncbi:hypothetical protein SCHPADRAFT_940646 [Schizopora paradoxa]|uniref:Uncharacterized protein n=1 Tax=Schizopora paradoxa TaxID=27342 RepID=A0A0H2RMS7_9AGAM|nr:hypothetical protein SCHPADRAFT_940646 [Schizopora paradoxa]